MAETAADLAGSGLSISDTAAFSFVGKDEIARVNKDFVGHQGPTDVICFDYRKAHDASESVHELATDIIVCPQVALEEAEKRRVPYSQELALYIVHGLLHAAGEDDISPPERRRMRSMERKIIAELKKKFILSSVFPMPSTK